MRDEETLRRMANLGGGPKGAAADVDLDFTEEPVEIEKLEGESALDAANRVERAYILGLRDDPENTKAPDGTPALEFQARERQRLEEEGRRANAEEAASKRRIHEASEPLYKGPGEMVVVADSAGVRVVGETALTPAQEEEQRKEAEAGASTVADAVTTDPPAPKDEGRNNPGGESPDNDNQAGG